MQVSCAQDIVAHMVSKQVVSGNCCGMPFCVENALAGHSKFSIYLFWVAYH